MSVEIEVVETVEEILGKLSAGRVLDVATGGGGFIHTLLETLKDFREIIGIDSNARPLEAARKAYNQENINFLLMDASHMNFPDEHFDTVCIANSLHHMADLPAVLSEMMRVCKPGGQLVISEMYRDGQSDTQLTHVLLHHWWAAVDSAEGISHHETFTRQEIIDLINPYGLHDMKLIDDKDIGSDPKEPELIQQLDGIIDRYIQRCQALNDGTELEKRGEELRQRVHRIGFHGATSLFITGKK